MSRLELSSFYLDFLKWKLTLYTIGHAINIMSLIVLTSCELKDAKSRHLCQLLF